MATPAPIANPLSIRLSLSFLMYPSRIVCLTEETTETLYWLGEQDRVVGGSGFTVRPPESRRKPRVSAFLAAYYEQFVALHPELDLSSYDLPADLVPAPLRR